MRSNDDLIKQITADAGLEAETSALKVEEEELGFVESYRRSYRANARRSALETNTGLKTLRNGVISSEIEAIRNSKLIAEEGLSALSKGFLQYIEDKDAGEDPSKYAQFEENWNNFVKSHPEAKLKTAEELYVFSQDVRRKILEDLEAKEGNAFGEALGWVTGSITGSLVDPVNAGLTIAQALPVVGSVSLGLQVAKSAAPKLLKAGYTALDLASVGAVNGGINVYSTVWHWDAIQANMKALGVEDPSLTEEAGSAFAVGMGATVGLGALGIGAGLAIDSARKGLKPVFDDMYKALKPETSGGSVSEELAWNVAKLRQDVADGRTLSDAQLQDLEKAESLLRAMKLRPKDVSEKDWLDTLSKELTEAQKIATSSETKVLDPFKPIDNEIDPSRVTVETLPTFYRGMRNLAQQDELGVIWASSSKDVATPYAGDNLGYMAEIKQKQGTRVVDISRFGYNANTQDLLLGLKKELKLTPQELELVSLKLEELKFNDTELLTFNLLRDPDMVKLFREKEVDGVVMAADLTDGVNKNVAFLNKDKIDMKFEGEDVPSTEGIKVEEIDTAKIPEKEQWELDLDEDLNFLPNETYEVNAALKMQNLAKMLTADKTGVYTFRHGADVGTKIKGYQSVFLSKISDLIGVTENMSKEARKTFNKVALRHIKGEKIDPELAKKFQPLIDATDDAIKQLEKVGIKVNKLQGWSPRKGFDAPKVLKVNYDEFESDMLARLGDMYDKDSGKLLKESDKRNLIKNMYDEMLGRKKTKGMSIQNTFEHERVFNYKSADDEMYIMDKYTRDYDLVTQYIRYFTDVSRNLALAERFGPNWKTTLPKLVSDLELEMVKDGKLAPGEKARYNIYGFESTQSADAQGIFSAEGAPLISVPVEDMVKIVSGGLDPASSEFLNSFNSAVFSLFRSAQLGKAITASFSDYTNVMTRTKLSGLKEAPFAKFWSRMLPKYKNADKKLLAEMAFIDDVVSNVDLIGMRFDQVDSAGTVAKVGNYMTDKLYKYQGLNWWTTNLQRRYASGFLVQSAKYVKNGTSGVPEFDKLMSRLTNSDLTELKKGLTSKTYFGQELDLIEGSNIDTSVMAKLQSILRHEMDQAVLTPDTAVRALMTGGAEAGTAAGGLSRSIWFAKSFPLTQTQIDIGNLMMNKIPVKNKLQYAAIRLGVGGLIAISSVQIREVLNGRDMMPYDDTELYVRAAQLHGGLSFLSDYALADNYSADVALRKSIGPIGTLLATGFSMIQATNWESPSKPIAELYRGASQFIPFKNYVLTDLAYQKWINEPIMELLNENEPKNRRRRERKMRKEEGRGRWWKEGEMLPYRLPDTQLDTLPGANTVSNILEGDSE